MFLVQDMQKKMMVDLNSSIIWMSMLIYSFEQRKYGKLNAEGI